MARSTKGDALGRYSRIWVEFVEGGNQASDIDEGFGKGVLAGSIDRSGHAGWDLAIVWKQHYMRCREGMRSDRPVVRERFATRLPCHFGRMACANTGGYNGDTPKCTYRGGAAQSRVPSLRAVRGEDR